MVSKRDSLLAKKNIVHEAIALFKEKGYQNVSVNEICKRSGISRNTFYYYFRKKEEIFDYYLIGPEIIASEYMMTMLKSTSYLDQLIQILEIQLKQMEEYGPIIISEVLKRNIDSKVHALTPNSIELHDVYKNLIQKGQEVGEIKNMADPEELVEALVYSAVGISTIWCSEDGKFDLLEKNRQMIKLIFNFDNPLQ